MKRLIQSKQDRTKKETENAAEFYTALACRGEVAVPPQVAEKMGVFEETAMTPEQAEEAEHYPDEIYPGEPEIEDSGHGV